MRQAGNVLQRRCSPLLLAALHANQPVTFLSLDALSFHLPVSIGAILSLTSHVTYTSNVDIDMHQHAEGPTIASVVVLAEIVDVETGRRDRSNTFHFSFALGKGVQKRVVPGEKEGSKGTAVESHSLVTTRRVVQRQHGVDRGQTASGAGRRGATELPNGVREAMDSDKEMQWVVYSVRAISSV